MSEKSTLKTLQHGACQPKNFLVREIKLALVPQKRRGETRPTVTIMLIGNNMSVQWQLNASEYLPLVLSRQRENLPTFLNPAHATQALRVSTWPSRMADISLTGKFQPDRYQGGRHELFDSPGR